MQLVLASGKLSQHILHCSRCLIGYQPRKLTAQDCAVLRNLAGMVVKEIERDQMLLEREHSGIELQRRNSRLNVWPCCPSAYVCYAALLQDYDSTACYAHNANGLPT